MRQRLRCFAKYVYEKGIITQPEFSVETRGGVMRPRLNLNRGAVESVTVDMGTPMFGRASIPMLGKGRFLMQKIRVLNREFTVSSMFMTIPHTVVFVDDISSIDVGRYGPAIERHPLVSRRYECQLCSGAGFGFNSGETVGARLRDNSGVRHRGFGLSRSVCAGRAYAKARKRKPGTGKAGDTVLPKRESIYDGACGKCF